LQKYANTHPFTSWSLMEHKAKKFSIKIQVKQMIDPDWVSHLQVWKIFLKKASLFQFFVLLVEIISSGCVKK